MLPKIFITDMAFGIQRKKLHISRALIKSKSVKKSLVIMDTLRYIVKLKLQIEAIKREYQYLIDHFQEVKVEKVGTRHLAVMVTCKKGEAMLVSILEAFERMNANVVQARVNDNHFFRMEAVVEADEIDLGVLKQAIEEVVKHNLENK